MAARARLHVPTTTLVGRFAPRVPSPHPHCNPTVMFRGLCFVGAPAPHAIFFLHPAFIVTTHPSKKNGVRCLRRRRWLRLWLSPPPPLVGGPDTLCARGHDRRQPDSCACGYWAASRQTRAGAGFGLTKSLNSCVAFVCRPFGRVPLRGRLGPLVTIQTCGASSTTRLWALTRPRIRFCSTRIESKVKVR